MSDTETNLALRGEREGKGVYVIRNGRGGEIRVGIAGTPDSFTPGELLQVAVATCAALSADHVLGSRLGHDFDAELLMSAEGVGADAPGGARITHLASEVVTDLSALTPERAEALVKRAQGAIERICAVGRTVGHGATHATAITDG